VRGADVVLDLTADRLVFARKFERPEQFAATPGGQASHGY
jgi:hypothetical protein